MRGAPLNLFKANCSYNFHKLCFQASLIRSFSIHLFAIDFQGKSPIILFVPMATEILPDKKLFPSREEIEPWKLVDPANQLFWDLRRELSLIPKFAVQAGLGSFWGKNEVEFQVGNDWFSVRHDHKKTNHNEQTEEGLRIMHNQKRVEDGKKSSKWEDIWILKVDRPAGGGGDYSSLNISYHSHVIVDDGSRFGKDTDYIGETRSEAAIQHIKDFTERLKKLAQVPKQTP